MSALVRVGLEPSVKSHPLENGFKTDKEEKIINEISIKLSEYVATDIVKYKMLDSDMFYAEWILKHDAVIKLSTVEMLVKNAEGYIYNIEMMYLHGGHFKLRVIFHKESVKQKYYKTYVPPSAVIKPVTVNSKDIEEVDLSDVENIKSLIEHVYHMKTTMPLVHMLVNNDLALKQYIVSFVGLEMIDHAFIIYVAQQLGLTFLERVDVYKNTQTIGNAVLQCLAVDFYVRKCIKEASFKFVPFSVSEDETNKCYVSKRAIRCLGENTDSEPEHVAKKRTIQT